MLPQNSLSQLAGTAGRTPFAVNAGTGITAQINYSFSITLLPQRKV